MIILSTFIEFCNFSLLFMTVCNFSVTFRNFGNFSLNKKVMVKDLKTILQLPSTIS